MSVVSWTTEESVPPQSMAGHAARKYTGAVAAGYDAKREQSPKWKDEDRIVRDMLKDIKPGDWVLDVPVGTGRFIPYYEERKFQVLGLDISGDMLMQSAAKVTDQTRVRLAEGDARQIERFDKSVDAAVMVRLTRWLSREDRKRALGELQRVARKKVIFTARVANHPHAYPYTDIAEALNGWRIARDEAVAGDENYRVICLEPDE